MGQSEIFPALEPSYLCKAIQVDPKSRFIHITVAVTGIAYWCGASDFNYNTIVKRKLCDLITYWQLGLASFFFLLINDVFCAARPLLK